MPCLAHSLNLVVRAAISISDDNVVRVQKRVRDIVSFFHWSVKTADELRKVQGQLSIPEHKL